MSAYRSQAWAFFAPTERVAKANLCKESQRTSFHGLVEQNRYEEIGEGAPRDRGDEEVYRFGQVFLEYRRRWGLSFQEKTNVKRKSVAARLPNVKKHHQYILYRASTE